MDPVRNDPNKNNPGQQPENGKPKSSGWVMLTVCLLAALAVYSIFNVVGNAQYTKKTWTDFRTDMTSQNISEAIIYSDQIIYLTKEEAAKPADDQKACYTGLPSNTDLIALANELN